MEKKTLTMDELVEYINNCEDDFVIQVDFEENEDEQGRKTVQA